MEDYGGALHTPYPVCRPEGSVAATQQPHKEIRKSSFLHSTYILVDRGNKDFAQPFEVKFSVT